MEKFPLFETIIAFYENEHKNLPKSNETKQQGATNKRQFYDSPITTSDPKFLSSTANTTSAPSTSLPNDLHNLSTANPGSGPSTSYQNSSYNLFMSNETLYLTYDLFTIFDDDVI